MSPSATPARQNEGGCRQVPRLPRETPRRPREAAAPPEPAQSPPSACLPRKEPAAPPEPAQSPPSAVSATPATQSEGGCHQAPRLPRKTVDVAKCHACHSRRRGAHRNPLRHQSPSAVSATPATQSEGGYHRVSRLPRKTKVNVAKCHACHAK